MSILHFHCQKSLEKKGRHSDAFIKHPKHSRHYSSIMHYLLNYPNVRFAALLSTFHWHGSWGTASSNNLPKVTQLISCLVSMSVNPGALPLEPPSTPQHWLLTFEPQKPLAGASGWLRVPGRRCCGWGGGRWPPSEIRAGLVHLASRFLRISTQLPLASERRSGSADTPGAGGGARERDVPVLGHQPSGTSAPEAGRPGRRRAATGGLRGAPFAAAAEQRRAALVRGQQPGPAGAEGRAARWAPEWVRD